MNTKTAAAADSDDAWIRQYLDNARRNVERASRRLALRVDRRHGRLRQHLAKAHDEIRRCEEILKKG